MFNLYDEIDTFLINVGSLKITKRLLTHLASVWYHLELSEVPFSIKKNFFYSLGILE